MAQEISFTASLTANKSGATNGAIGKSVSALQFNWTGSVYIQGTLAVLTSATVVPLGSVTLPGFAVFINLDATNFLTLFNGASGAVFARLKPGYPAFVPMDPTCVPYAKADTATCDMEYLILQQ